MSDTENLTDIPVNVNTIIERDEELQIIKDELIKNLNNYRKTINYMLGDAPLGCLGLNPATEKCLLNHGCLRIYDLFDLDFVKVKGLGVVRIRDLTTCLDKFLSML